MKFLKSTRFGTCSPSAMRSGAISRARARCASTSSGCVGSSIQYGSTADNAWHMCRASRRLHCWLASNIRRDLAREGAVRFHVIRVRGLLDPVRVHCGQRLAHVPSLPEAPLLVSVEHQPAVRPGDLAQHGRAPQVALGFSRPYLKLECADAPVVILEPAYRSVVAWVAGEQNAFPQRARRQVIAQKRQRFLPVQNVFYVAEVEQCQDLLWL